MNINLLKSKMALQNINNSDLANKLTLSQGAVSQKLNGKNRFSLDEVRKLKEILDLDADEIVEIFLAC